MKNIYKFITAFFLILTSVLPGLGIELPKEVTNFVKTNFPNASIRFDGLIEMPDGTKYLPVLPLNYADVNNPAEIIQTIPAKKLISAKPEFILFANDIALLKIIKRADGTITLSNSPAIPLKVKMGILPQDLVVPANLVIPPELKVIAGDLKIPVREENSTLNLITGKSLIKSVISKTDRLISPSLKGFVNLNFYTSTPHSNAVNIISPLTGRTLKAVPLSSIPSDIAITANNRYILVSCIAANSVSIIDTKTNSFIREINIGKLPGSILISDDSDRAYVANRASSSISIIDLKNMNVIKEIGVTGSPAGLTLSEDKSSIYYYDIDSGKIYRVQPDEKVYKNDGSDYSARPQQLCQINNISKISLDGNKLFILSRSDNTLSVFDTDKKQIIKTIQVGAKPVDMSIIKPKNKLYVLSAEANTLEIINLADLNIVNTVVLNNKGFSKSLITLPYIDKALVSNIETSQIAIIDLDDEKVIDYMPVNIPIASIVIHNKLNEENK